jgi:hypothetical protein
MTRSEGLPHVAAMVLPPRDVGPTDCGLVTLQ